MNTRDSSSDGEEDTIALFADSANTCSGVIHVGRC